MLKTQKFLSIILVAVLTLGCHQLNPLPNPDRPEPGLNSILVNLDSQFELKLRQLAVITSENIKIKFLKVEEDSRCPCEVQCIWPGQVKIIVNVLKNDRDLGKFNLISRMREEDLAVKKFDGYSIKLIEVAPYPKKTQRLESSDYLVTLVVSRDPGV